MDYITRNQEAVVEWLEGLGKDDLINIWNDMVRENRSEDEIYSNDEEFFETFFSTPMEAVRAAKYGDYEFYHAWVKFNGYANLETTNSPEDWIDLDELAGFILDNEKMFNHWVELQDEEEE